MPDRLLVADRDNGLQKVCGNGREIGEVTRQPFEGNRDIVLLN